MVTLSGHRVSTGISYYHQDGFFVDLSTAGFAAGSTWSVTFTATAGTDGFQIGYDAFLMRADPSEEHCFHWSAITPGDSPHTPMIYGPAHVGDGSEWTATVGATGCTDFTRIYLQIRTYLYPELRNVEWDWSVTYTGTGGTVAPCAYGTQPKAGVGLVLVPSVGIATAIGL